MDRVPKPEPVSSPPAFASTDPRNLMDMSVSELVAVLRTSFRIEDFDAVEEVLEIRYAKIDEEVILLQKKADFELLKRSQAEEEVRKKEEECVRGKKAQESYEKLLKNVKEADAARLADKGALGVLKKMNADLESELMEMKMKGVVDGNSIAELKKKNADLESELKEMKKKGVDDNNSFAELKKKNADLESELKEMKKKGVDDNSSFAELKKKNADLESDLKEMKKKGVDDNNSFAELKKKNADLESELKEMKKKGVDDNSSFAELKKKNADLESDLKELKKKNVELVSENYQLMDDSNILAELRSRVTVLEDEKLKVHNALVALRRKNNELEEAGKKDSATMEELREKNHKLAEEKRRAEELAESLKRKFGELNERVARMEEDIRILMSADTGGGNIEGDSPALEGNEEEEIVDYEFGNDTGGTMKRNEDTNHSLGSAPGDGIVRLENNVEIINLDDSDNDDDGCTSKLVHVKKTLSGITNKNEHQSSSGGVHQKTVPLRLELLKRKMSFSDRSSSSSSSSDNDFDVDNLPMSSAFKKIKT